MALSLKKGGTGGRVVMAVSPSTPSKPVSHCSRMDCMCSHSELNASPRVLPKSILLKTVAAATRPESSAPLIGECRNWIWPPLAFTRNHSFGGRLLWHCCPPGVGQTTELLSLGCKQLTYIYKDEINENGWPRWEHCWPAPA